MTEKKDPLTVMKFGGSCLQNVDSYAQITSIVKHHLKFTKVLVVVSAIKGMTNKLINFYEKSCK